MQFFKLAPLALLYVASVSAAAIMPAGEASAPHQVSKVRANVCLPVSVSYFYVAPFIDEQHAGCWVPLKWPRNEGCRI